MTARDEDFRKNVRELTQLDREFPERLRNIPDPPDIIYVRGPLPEDDVPSAAIIGARDASPYGLDIARSIGKTLAMRGVNVISGMAAGIDAAGQWGAVQGGGRTCAVFGCGLDICYPVSNFNLYEEILNSGGSIVSEYPLGSPPLGWHFSKRNRIISGLADVVLVIEAKERSGTSITVGNALDQGKQVFALPGRITDRLSQGCNRLIREGACILTGVEDVLESLHLSREVEQLDFSRDLSSLGEDERAVYEILPDQAVHVDALIAKSLLPFQKLSEILLSLEILGFCESPKSGYYRKK